MNTLFIIGGIAVLSGIIFMTALYYQQAAELRRAKKYIRFLKKELSIYAKDYEFTYEIASEDDVKDIRFGEF